jgi:hypothetical protein
LITVRFPARERCRKVQRDGFDKPKQKVHPQKKRLGPICMLTQNQNQTPPAVLLVGARLTLV